MRPGFRFRIAWLAMFLLALALAGCGKKGPLYLPDAPPRPPAAPAPGK